MAESAKQSPGVKQKHRSPTEEDDVSLQPWFLPKPLQLAIRKVLPSIHLAKMRYYFDDYGCLRCQKRNTLYGSNGFCESCCKIVRDRVTRSLKRRLQNVGVVPADVSDDALKCASEILAYQQGGDLVEQVESKRSVVAAKRT
jgi:hypothetical protein